MAYIVNSNFISNRNKYEWQRYILLMMERYGRVYTQIICLASIQVSDVNGGKGWNFFFYYRGIKIMKKVLAKFYFIRYNITVRFLMARWSSG